MDAGRAGSARGPSPAPTRLRWGRDDGWLAIAAPALIFLGHMLYGALLPQTALVLTAIAAALLCACLLRPPLRKALAGLDGLRLPAALFGAVIFVALWSLTPVVLGGPHPIWAYLKIWPGAATIDRSATLLETIKLLGLGCFFVLGLAAGALDRRARASIITLLIMGAGLGAWALLTLATGNQSGGSERLEASFMSANTAATVFAASLMLTVGPAISQLTGTPGRRMIGATLYSLGALLFLACIFATASRGAFLAMLCGFVMIAILMIFSGRLKWSKAALMGLAGAAAIILLLAISGEFLLTRLMGGSHEFASRSFILHVHWKAFLDSPLFGYGLGTFDTINRMLLSPASFPKIWTVRAAHSVYLGWLEQGGLLGALPMFACIAALIATTARRAFDRSRMLPTLFALLAVDTVFLVHGATDFGLEMFSVAAMWTYLLGLQFSLAQGSSTR